MPGVKKQAKASQKNMDKQAVVVRLKDGFLKQVTPYFHLTKGATTEVPRSVLKRFPDTLEEVKPSE